jgi:hypothetical protein
LQLAFSPGFDSAEDVFDFLFFRKGREEGYKFRHFLLERWPLLLGSFCPFVFAFVDLRGLKV